MDLAEYIVKYTSRTACKCGKCIVSGGEAPTAGRSVNLTFFTVYEKTDDQGQHADPEVLKTLIKEWKGVFGDVNPLDGEEHNYMELGGWLGDQGLALLFIALCDLAGIGKALSPDTVMPFLSEEIKKDMAGAGLVTVKSKG